MNASEDMDNFFRERGLLDVYKRFWLSNKRFRIVRATKSCALHSTVGLNMIWKMECTPQASTLLIFKEFYKHKNEVIELLRHSIRRLHKEEDWEFTDGLHPRFTFCPTGQTLAFYDIDDELPMIGYSWAWVYDADKVTPEEVDRLNKHLFSWSKRDVGIQITLTGDLWADSWLNDIQDSDSNHVIEATFEDNVYLRDEDRDKLRETARSRENDDNI